MRKENDKRNILIGSLVGVILLMSVGFALFSQNLDLNATGSVTGDWNVKFEADSFSQISKSNGATVNTAVIDSEKLEATFDVSFNAPGDKVVYELAVENTGSIDAILNSSSLIKKLAYEGTNSNSLKFSYEVKDSSKTTTYAAGYMIGENAEVKTTTLTPANAILTSTNGKQYVIITFEYLADVNAQTGEGAAYTLSLNYAQKTA